MNRMLILNSILILSGLTGSVRSDAMTIEDLNQRLGNLYQTVYANSKARAPIFGNATLKDDADYFALALKSYCVMLESYKPTKPKDPELTNRDVFTIVKLDQNPNNKRLTIYDIRNKKIALQTWTSHGHASISHFEIRVNRPPLNEILATYQPRAPQFFSNVGQSNKSSAGMSIVAVKTYDSPTVHSDNVKQGLSLLLYGIDKSKDGRNDLNSKNDPRAIYVHGFTFTPWDPQWRSDHQIPTSDGCLMIPRQQILSVLDQIKGSALLMDHDRLDQSINESAHQADLKMLADLKTTFESNAVIYKNKYHYPESVFQTQRALLNKEIAKLRAQYEETYRYFKNESQYVGYEPDNIDACAAALGI